jgi:hypothetical protein
MKYRGPLALYTDIMQSAPTNSAADSRPTELCARTSKSDLSDLFDLAYNRCTLLISPAE